MVWETGRDKAGREKKEGGGGDAVCHTLMSAYPLFNRLTATPS